MNEKEPVDFTRRYIEAGLKLTERDLMREKFITGPYRGNAPPQFSGDLNVSAGNELDGPLTVLQIVPVGGRMSAGDNFLADVLADPELAGALRDFIPPLLGRAVGEEINSRPPDDIFPWAFRPPAAPAWPDPLNGAAGEDADILRDQIAKTMAVMAGAALAGAALLDEQYLYTHSLDGRPIFREKTPRPGFESDGGCDLNAPAIVLPARADRVLVLAFVRDPKVMGMNPGLAKLRPFDGWLDWPGQIAAVLKLADWLSAQGYLALPSAGGLLLAAHYGALAGLGELGRQGLLISPEYGPNLRLFTIITDYPFMPGRPAVFGIADYCETCQRCINECPAKALTEGHRRPGLFQWPVNRRACFDNWLEKKDPCRKCIEVCPYTHTPLCGSR